MSSASIALSSDSLSDVTAGWLVVPLFENSDLPDEVQQLDQKTDGAVSRLRGRGDFKGKAGEIVLLPVVPGIEADRLVLAGLGSAESFTPARLEKAILSAAKKAAGSEHSTISVALPASAVEKLGATSTAATIVTSLIVATVGPGLYKAEKDRFAFEAITLCHGTSTATKELKAGIERGQILAESINLARELVNRHPGELDPEAFAARAATVAADLGIRGTVFDEPMLEDEKMNAMLAVSRGSGKPPRMVALEYKGAGPDAPWLALCGKGVTFDSGGLSLKPSDGMIAMKCDMAGAATVLGAITAIARLKLPVNVLGLMGLVENMVGPKSYKLGEVLTARNGVTIEIHNTDAEGRLVLADVLSYAVDHKAAKIVDLATLTGACVVALGEEVSGAFTNDQPWCDEVLAAAKRAGEDIWQLPMFDSYADQLKSEVADIKNVGSKWGGAITAAKFLERFVAGTPWVHLDIAGPSFVEGSKANRDAGGTGACVRTLVELAEAFPDAK